MDQELPEDQEDLGHKERTDPPDSVVLWEVQAAQEPQEPTVELDYKDHKGWLEHQDAEDHEDQQENQDQPEVQDPRELSENVAEVVLLEKKENEETLEVPEE